MHACIPLSCSGIAAPLCMLYKHCMSSCISPVTTMIRLKSINHIHVCASLVLLSKPLVTPNCKDYSLLIIRSWKNP